MANMNAENRHAWVQQKLKALQAGTLLLDAGCGPQKYRKFCEHLLYMGQDFAKYNGKGDNEGLQNSEWEYGKLDYTGNIWEIDEKDDFFDAILCTEVIEHVPFPNETIKEFARLLKTGGVLILTAPFCSIPHMTPFYFYNGFSKDWYEKMAELNNFEITEISHNGNPTEYVIQEFYRLANTKVKKLFAMLSIPLLRIFYKTDSEHLHFGYHVVMRKQ